ncbi:MAG: phosphoadenylyl-sulfate reductase [Saprospiraceae bacterium]
MSLTKEDINRVKDQLFQAKNVSELISRIGNKYGSQAVFSTSFSEEDQIIYHEISTQSTDIEVFTLDTGRLFQETFSTWSRTLEIYNYPIKAYYPNTEDIQSFIEKQGPNSFYASVENRKSCCHLRKVEPLQRALQGKQIWITGIRAAHSPDRGDMASMEWDETHQLIKIHPLLHWTNEEVKSFIKTREIPYNPLHDKGFVSIGCAPCTRATKPGEDFRAGRWWWEDSSKKECGLHVHAESK